MASVLAGVGVVAVGFFRGTISGRSLASGANTP
jgi:hypothetical protein